MTSTLVANPCEQRTLRFRSRLSPPECARRLEDAAFPLNASLSTFGFHLGRTIDDGTISFGLERFRWFTSWLWKPYFSGTLQSDPATRGTTVVGSFGFRPGARGTAVFFAVLALSATAVSLLLGEWRLLAIPIITGVAFADLPFTRWACRGDLPEMTVFLTATLEAAEDGKR